MLDLDKGEDDDDAKVAGCGRLSVETAPAAETLSEGCDVASMDSEVPPLIG